MKKAITFLLAAILMFSMAACGNGDSDADESSKMTKEEMLEEAIAIEDIKEISDIIIMTAASSGYPYPRGGDWLGIYALHELNEQNPLVFERDYLDKIYIITGYVESIDSEYIILNIHHDGGANLDMNMRVHPADKDELLTIKTTELISVVGLLTTSEETAEMGWPFYINSAYVVTAEVQAAAVGSPSFTGDEDTEDANALTAEDLEALTAAKQWTTESGSVMYEFYADGTGTQTLTFAGTVSNYNITWEVLGTEIIMQTNIAGVPGTASLTISPTEDGIQLSNDSAIFTPVH